MESEVAPLIKEYWARDKFPHEIVPEDRRARNWRGRVRRIWRRRRQHASQRLCLKGAARVDASIATFRGVHTGLSAGSIYLCGDEEQKQRWLPAMMRFETIGSFGLTEPLVGSATAGGMMTTCRREGDAWVLDGEKKWIGNATFADINVIWARDQASGEVKGFVVGMDNPGFSVRKIENKIALRVVQNGLITLKDCRVPESDRVQKADSFKDVAKVLRMTRAGVAWFAVGCGRGAHEHALRYATERMQFGRPIAGFPARSGSSRADARQRHDVPVPHVEPRAVAERWDHDGRAGVAGEGVLHREVPRNGRLCAGTARRKTESFWKTTSDGSSPTRRPSTPTG